MALTAGTTLRPYKIASALGVGGMGEVYRAIDTRLNRTVAVKVLLPHFAHLRVMRSLKTLKPREERVIKIRFGVGEGSGRYLPPACAGVGDTFRSGVLTGFSCDVASLLTSDV